MLKKDFGNALWVVWGAVLCHSLVRLDNYSTIKPGTSITIHNTFATKLAPLSRIIYLDHLGAVVVLPTGAIGFLFNQL